MEAALARLESVTARLEAAAAKMGAEEEVGDGPPPYVVAMQKICDSEVADLVKACAKIKVKTSGKLVQDAWKVVTNLVAATATCKKPSTSELGEFLAPLQEATTKMEKQKMKRDKKKTPDRRYHRTALYEVLVTCSWVTMAPPAGLPHAHVTGQLDAAMFNLNKVLKDNKEEPTKNFVAACKALLKAQGEYIKENFKTGLTWRGQADLLNAASAVEAAKTAVKEEEKEEPKKKTPAKKAAPTKKTDGANMSNVFGELSKGLKVTSGLKKVTKDQKTKYRKKESDRGLVKTKSKKKKPTKKKNPVTKLQGGRYMFMDYFEGVIDIPDDCDMKTNAFVTCCEDCGMEFKTKVKAITIESCKNVRIAVEQVVSSVEMVNCKRVTIYVNGNVPTIQIDKCESPQIVVMNSAPKCPDIITSNVTAGNVELPAPTKDDPDHMVEFPIPEQFKITALAGNTGLSTEAVSHG